MSRATLSPPDLWLKPDGKTLQGYGSTPGNGPWYSAETVRGLLAAEREACAKIVADSAARLLTGKRVPQVDRHTADVLERHAERIRDRGKAGTEGGA